MYPYTFTSFSTLICFLMSSSLYNLNQTFEMIALLKIKLLSIKLHLNPLFSKYYNNKKKERKALEPFWYLHLKTFRNMLLKSPFKRFGMLWCWSSILSIKPTWLCYGSSTASQEAVVMSDRLKSMERMDVWCKIEKYTGKDITYDHSELLFSSWLQDFSLPDCFKIGGKEKKQLISSNIQLEVKSSSPPF